MHGQGALSQTCSVRLKTSPKQLFWCQDKLSYSLVDDLKVKGFPTRKCESLLSHGQETLLGREGLQQWRQLPLLFYKVTWQWYMPLLRTEETRGWVDPLLHHVTYKPSWVARGHNIWYSEWETRVSSLGGPSQRNNSDFPHMCGGQHR